jgi:hypothetical protein
MDKALVMMNIRLSSVLSDMQGASAMSIIKAILGGEDLRFWLNYVHLRCTKRKKKK